MEGTCGPQENKFSPSSPTKQVSNSRSLCLRLRHAEITDTLPKAQLNHSNREVALARKERGVTAGLALSQDDKHSGRVREHLETAEGAESGRAGSVIGEARLGAELCYSGP